MHTGHHRPPDSIKIYSRAGLRLYDALVMGVLARHVWDCPADAFVEHYRRHITSNHADIGVGTGYCLDHCVFDTANPRLTLIDLQPNCLEYAARRLARYRPQVLVHDVLQPMPEVVDRFDSVGIGGVLHCPAACATRAACSTRSGRSLVRERRSSVTAWSRTGAGGAPAATSYCEFSIG